MITAEAIPAADKILAVAITEQVAVEIIAAAAEVSITVTAIIAAADLRRDINPLTPKRSMKNILRASDLFDAFFVAY